MLAPNTLEEWRAGRLLSVGDHRQWLLVEMPRLGLIDVLPLADALRTEGVRLIVAHAERYPELLDNLDLCESWIAAGCLFQVTARAIEAPPDVQFERALKRWARRGIIHLLGSDGHGLDRRRPTLAGGVERLSNWIGPERAEQIAATWGRAVLVGEPVAVPPPRRAGWFARRFGW
jgi:protein-tyrosine phosphatase